MFRAYLAIFRRQLFTFQNRHTALLLRSKYFSAVTSGIRVNSISENVHEHEEDINMDAARENYAGAEKKAAFSNKRVLV
jgi:hypothetical protein